MSSPAAPRNQVFVSYSHADEEFLLRLRKHLSQLERRNIKVWTDKDIQPGMQWADEIRKALASTKVAVLMISTDFLTSDFITKDELPPLLEAAGREGVHILPVIVKPSTFGDPDIVPLSRYQAVNMGRPLSRLDEKTDREDEFVNILQAIRKAMESPSGAAAVARPVVAPPARPAEPAPVDDGADQGGDEEAEGEEGICDEETLAEWLCANLAAMLEEPGLQALSIQCLEDDGAVEMMVVAEGRNGALLVEVLGNDELPSEYQLTRAQQRSLVDDVGFNAPEQRGERYWMVIGGDGEQIDLPAFAQALVGWLGQLWGVPSDDWPVQLEFVEN